MILDMNIMRLMIIQEMFSVMLLFYSTGIEATACEVDKYMFVT
jgi:hypothetical protein